MVDPAPDPGLNPSTSSLLLRIQRLEDQFSALKEICLTKTDVESNALNGRKEEGAIIPVPATLPPTNERSLPLNAWLRGRTPMPTDVPCRLIWADGGSLVILYATPMDTDTGLDVARDVRSINYTDPDDVRGHPVVALVTEQHQITLQLDWRHADWSEARYRALVAWFQALGGNVAVFRCRPLVAETIWDTAQRRAVEGGPETQVVRAVEGGRGPPTGPVITDTTSNGDAILPKNLTSSRSNEAQPLQGPGRTADQCLGCMLHVPPTHLRDADLEDHRAIFGLHGSSRSDPPPAKRAKHDSNAHKRLPESSSLDIPQRKVGQMTDTGLIYVDDDFAENIGLRDPGFPSNPASTNKPPDKTKFLPIKAWFLGHRLFEEAYYLIWNKDKMYIKSGDGPGPSSRHVEELDIGMITKSLFYVEPKEVSTDKLLVLDTFENNTSYKVIGANYSAYFKQGAKHGQGNIMLKFDSKSSAWADSVYVAFLEWIKPKVDSRHTLRGQAVNTRWEAGSRMALIADTRVARKDSASSSISKAVPAKTPAVPGLLPLDTWSPPPRVAIASSSRRPGIPNTDRDRIAPISQTRDRSIHFAGFL
ncbi:hypothetical protein C8R44DRAFT_977311 [Mycena epipterygia]|nr:hypothetical protein C8R44DRAFT_977311 [Mycena epipterygia]